MPFSTVQIPPGVAPDLPEYSGKGLWRASDHIRFVGNRAENIGAYSPLSATAKNLIGAPRAQLSWSLLSGTRVLAVATHLKLYIYRGGVFYDITPVRESGTAGSNPIAVTSGSTVVTFTAASHGAFPGDYFRISGASAVGGVDVNGEWVVASTPGADTLTFVVPAAATATATGGGTSVAYEFDIHAGRQHATAGTGFGVGPYGLGTYGTPRAGGVIRTMRVPTLSLWGEDLVVCIDDLYRWDATDGVQTRAVAISGAPEQNIGAVVSTNDRHLMVFGAGGDPMTVQWPDQETLTSWTPGVASTANTLRLWDGSRIVSAAVVQNTTLVWTDKALFGIDFINQADASHRTYRIASIDPPAGWNAVIVDGSTAWWLGGNQFYRYDGRVEPLPLPVSETVFNEIDFVQSEKICGGTNYRWNEVQWFYPVEGAGPQENSRYVKINTKTLAPDLGQMARSTWGDAGVFPHPIAVSPVGIVYKHEQPAVFPTVSIEFKTRKYPSSTTYKQAGPYTVIPTTEILDRQFRGRAVSMKISGTMKCGNDIVPWFLESGIFDVSEGNEVMQVFGVIPDFAFRDAVSLGDLRFDIQPDGEQ